MTNGVIGSEDIVVLDEEANTQYLELGEEWGDSGCDTTVLEDEEEEEEEDDDDEEGAWYDSDDTAFDHEEDDIFKLGTQPETLMKIEPEGVWTSSEATTVGEPW